MASTSRALTITAILFAVAIMAPAGGGLSAQDPERDPRCRSDEGTVRTCLVPQARIEGRANIPLPGSECYWLQEDEKEKRKQYKRKANGRPRQFAFQVTNLCARDADVRFDLAVAGDLRFLTAACEVVTGASVTGPFHERPLGTIRSGAAVVVTCDTQPYPHKWIGSVTRRREFRLAVTAYGTQSLPVPILFDPEIVLEKSGHD